MTHRKEAMAFINIRLTIEVHRPVLCFGFPNKDILRNTHLLLLTMSQINGAL